MSKCLFSVSVARGNTINNKRDKIPIALILAAGRGERLSQLTSDRPKCLVRLAGVPILCRILQGLQDAGVRRACIVTGYRGEQIVEEIGPDFRGIKIDYVENPDWEKGNLYSLLAASRQLKERFLLLMSDHLCDARILAGLIDAGLNSSVRLAVDSREATPEDTKVLEKEGKIIDIGKQVEGNCIDTGIFLCSPKVFSYARQAADEGRVELSDCIKRAALGKDAETFHINRIDSYVPKLRRQVQPWWVDIDTEEDLKRAKRILVETASKGASDLLAYYVHTPIENKLVYHLADLNITPNQVTALVNIVAYAVTALFYLGYLLPASILTFVVGIMDGLDGKLARVKNQTSKVGLLEHSFDLLFEFSWFIALSMCVYRTSGKALALMCALGILLFVSFYRHTYDQFRKAMGRSLDDYGRFERAFRRVAGRRNLYNIPIFISILLGVPLYSLIFVFFHSLLTAVVYAARAIKHMRAGPLANQKLGID